MMTTKSFFLSLAGLCTSLVCISQATLPTSFDFATAPATLPTGWTTNTTANYTSGLPDNGSTSNAGKLQATGHHFTVHFFDAPGTLTYNLRSYGTSSFVGTLIVEESINGTSWTTLHTFNDDDFDGQWEEFSDTPSQTSRYIRFNLSNKVSGTNAGLDDVSIDALASVSEEINAVYDGASIPSGTGITFGTAVSNTLPLKVGIQNLGTSGTLTISNVNLTGTAAADYTVASSPTSVAPQSTDTITINYTPSASGNRTAQLSITNSDANENPYVILLNGIGGTSATEPSANPTNLTGTALKTYRVRGAFTPSTADGFIVLFRKNQPFTDLPADGTEYSAGEAIGNAKVAHVGTSGSFEIREALANTTYHVKIVAFNGSGSFINYRTSDVLTDSLKTPVTSMREMTYYNGVDELNTTFVSDLHDVINPHSVRFYSNYGPDMVPRFLSRDTTNGQDVITGVYSGFQVVFTPPFNWTATNLNREHTLPASWMPTYGDETTPEYQDYHHLFPAIETANFQRSNYPMGEVVNATNSYGQGKVGTSANGGSVYEPRDAQKGDAVRAMMYMQTAYHDPTGGHSWSLDDLSSQSSNQDPAVYVEWHLFDLPSKFEMSRNDYLDSLQQNRNPFVDSAHWVCYIDFQTMGYISTPDSTCLAITKPEEPDSNIGVGRLDSPDNWLFFPNPTSDYINLGHRNAESFSVEVIDVTGKIVLSQASVFGGAFDLQSLQPGMYLVRLISTTSDDHTTFRLMKE